MEADLAFRLAKEKVGLNSKEAARIIANEKEQIIKKSGILDYYQVNEELLRWEAFAFSDSTVNMLYAVIGVVIFIIIFD